MLKQSIPAITLLVALSGCAPTWSVSSVDQSSLKPSGDFIKTSPASIQIIEQDVNDRGYVVLGDITATVNKTTIFNANPTKEMVNEKLRAEASKLGADAVILVRYGDGGISLMSWGSLQGKGRAIKFQ
ncbi:hypothetical protein [Burkholderia gladioli]|uniref:hypothetical protein n=1 Tax=Burkholderia gladioli TaxID=28095 RepID=UPI00163E6F46|nr:hypothetical protein [Burkholderia gladioli]